MATERNDRTSNNNNKKKNNNKEHASSSVQRRKSLKRKEAARKSLIDSIQTKQGDAKYSFSSVAYEKMKSDIKFPRVTSSERSVQRDNNTPLRKCDSSKSHSPNSSLEILDESGRSDRWSRDGYAVYRNSSNQNISLPEIIMEFNIVTNKEGACSCAMSPSTETKADDRMLGAPYEDYLKTAKYGKFNPYRSKYRPVTPGLLESLSKLKLPSKVKTEQWIRSSQTAQKSLHTHVYKTDHISEWIYSD